jgi:hypothetical protein
MLWDAVTSIATTITMVALVLHFRINCRVASDGSRRQRLLN